ncbi:hypothetical protein [Citromicrobium bathyomarinum]|uniref:hypothetical protein n=1 Tax=Citromicrobium bathyomarinum TaxID=72174 RepID=UPI003159F936
MMPLDPSDLQAQKPRRATLIERLHPTLALAKDFLARRRRALLGIATILFVGGFAWSLDAAQIGLAAIAWVWLLASVFLGFAGVVLNGLELGLCAAAVGKRFPPIEAIRLSSVGILSNLLPIPASALVRGGGLVARGASVVESGRILLYVGLLRFTVAGAFTGVALTSFPLVGGSLLASAALFALIVRSGGFRVATGLLGLRVAMLGVVAVRLLLCFWALGASADLYDAALHAIAPVVGSVVGLVPGGIGVSETIGAGLAMIVRQSPAVAFAALALNRLGGYLCSFITLALFEAADLVRQRRPA